MSILTVHYLQQQREAAIRRAKELAFRRRVDLHQTKLMGLSASMQLQHRTA